MALTITITDPILAELAERVLARPDAADALDYVLSVDEGGPSCGCGADHWSCDYDQEDDDLADDDEDTEDEEEEEEEEEEDHLARKLADDMNATDAIAGID